MDNDPSTGRPRVLIMEGAAFSAGIVTSFAHAIQTSGKYHVDGLGYANPVGIPFDHPREAIYRTMSYYPPPPTAPKNLREAIQVASALLSFSRVSAPVANEPRGLKGYAFRKVHFKQLRGFIRRMLDYDLYHWHCLEPQSLPILDDLPSDAKFIVTLWGSDIYRTCGVAEYARQLKVAQRASVVTMATPELADTFLSKFGRDLQPKVRIIGYGLELVDAVDRFQRDDFRRVTEVDSAKISIVVGNNASPSNQHEFVLREIAKLPPQLLSQVAIVVPMTYTDTCSEYVNSIRTGAEQLGLPVRILDRRLSSDDLARFRVATDIMIHVPITDQFSGAMLESLAAGAVLITGGWLPYRRLRVAGVYYHEVFDVKQISSTLSPILERFDLERSQAKKNRPIVQEMVSWRSIAPQWTSIYDELLLRKDVQEQRVSPK